MRYPLYLDYNATTPLDPRVISAIAQVQEEHFGNPASATHAYGWYAAELVQIAREQVAQSIGATSEQIIFTSGATESINLALQGICHHSFRASGTLTEIVTFPTEHRATLDCLNFIEGIIGKTTIVPVQADGSIQLDTLRAALCESTGLVSLCLANNEIGTIHDIVLITSLVRSICPSCIIHLDASQALGKIAVDIDALDIDLLSLSGHKMYGPKGVGALYLRNKTILTRLSPMLHGGGHEQGLRSGTLNVPAIVGFGVACALVKELLPTESGRITELSNLFFSRLSQEVNDVVINGPATNRLPGNLNFRIPGVPNARLIGMLQSQIAFSTTSACTSNTKKPSHVLAAIGLSRKEQECSVRLSFGRFSTKEDALFAANLFSETITQIRSSKSPSV